MVEFTLPWIELFIETVKKEYSKSPPEFHILSPNSEDIQYVTTISETQDSFDKLGLKADFSKRLKNGKAVIYKCTSKYGEILLVKFKEDIFDPPWNTWWRAIRMLSPTSVRVVIFAHPKKRLSPSHGHPLTEEHVNGGMTMRCNSKTIVVYRKEEATRVLIHELFHANCSDPYNLDIPFLEADTEAWAELVLCAMASKGDMKNFKRILKDQIEYAMKQSSSAEKYHSVEDDSDYAWRYLSGRFDVWKRLGIVFNTKNTTEKVKSLRFTICEPDNY